MALRCALFLAVVTAGGLAVPFEHGDSAASCATSCPESTKFNWAVGKTYEYRYESDVKTLIAGTTEEHSSLHIRATALIEVLGPCEMALRLSDVSLEDSSPSQYESRQHVEQSWEFKRSLQERSLRFAFLDGRIESVCPEEGEETWVVNLKKGIISAFQNTQTRLDSGTVTVESDIAGTCPVEYEVEGYSWGTRTVRKSKDLLGCTERMGHFTAFQSTPYDVDSAIQSLPLMKSTHECRQQIKDGILTESSCVELHVFRPFSRGNNGAVTEVSYKLSLNKENSGVSTRLAAVGKRSSLLFEHEINKEEMLTTSRQAQLAIDKLCRKSRDEITTDVPRLFKELVDQMRRLDQRTLQNFYRSASGSCDKAPKFLRDAIPVLGTPSSVTLIRDLVINGEVSETDGQIWLTSMAFIANPTREMLAQVKPLLTTSHNHRMSVLAISTMVRTHCRRQTNCATEPEVSDIIRILEDNLRYNCKAQSDNEHDLILMSLKAIGNTGHAPQAVPTINRCFRNREVPVEIRVTALQAFRRMSCETEMSNVKELLATNLEDSELRIHAYLTLMRCANSDVLRYVRDVLEREEVNQVGSFIWTHLTNLMETSSPHKQDIRAIMENVSLKKKFDVDKRKYSRNVEWSAFSQLLNVGGMAEGNLIWSEKSFVPRSAAINLTVDMFGESVNVLEIGGRVQGLEKTLEKLFAEQDNTVERRKRATDEIAAMDRKYDCKRDSPQASYYIRVFGNEISYDDFHDFDLDTIKGKLNYFDWLIGLSKEHNFEVTKTMLFLDANMIVPTAAGLPLKLTVDGISSVSVSVSGKLDIRQMFSSLSTFNIDGTVKPSASMEITGEMGIDAHVARTGIKMKTTLHTSTVAQGKIQMKDGRIFNLDIKPPQDNTQVLSANNKFFIVHRDVEREQKMLTKKKIESKTCSGEKFITLTGLELCAELSLPWAEGKDDVPWFVLWGPASASLVLNKKDTHRSYLMEVKYIRERETVGDDVTPSDSIRLYLDTPGSSINRKVLVDFTLNRNDKRLSIILDTPWKKATLQGSFTNNAEMKRIFTTATVDGRDEYVVNAELATAKRSYTFQYTPKVEISIPGRQKILVSADVKHRPGRKAIFTVTARNVFQGPIRASGTITTINEPRQIRYDTELNFSSHLLSGKIDAFVDNSREQMNSISSKFDVQYTYRNQPEQKIQFEQRYIDSSKYDTLSHTFDSSWSTTLAERYNGDAHVDFVMDKDSLSTNVDAGFDQNRRIVYTETASLSLDRGQKLDVDMSLSVPFKNIDYTGKIGYMHSEDEFKVSGALKCCMNQETIFDVRAIRHSVRPLKVEVEAKVIYPGRDMLVSGSVEERAANVYHQHLNIQLQKYKNIEVNSVYRMSPRHELTTDITIPDTPKISIKGHLKPDLENVQAHGEVSYNGKTYLTDANWTHRGTMSNFNTEANVEVAYPERRITVRGSARRDGSEITSNVETKWDANRDEAKKFVMSSSVNIERMTPGLDLQLSFYPRQFVNLKANGKYETRGWYKSDSDVEGSLSLQSSFENFEDISAAFVHDRTPKLYKTSGEVSWKRGQKITGVVNVKKHGSWANSAMDAEVTTPFRGARRINADMVYILQGKRLSTNAKARLGDKQITLDFDGELDVPGHRLSTDVTFTSPFAGLESLRTTVQHNDDGQRYESSVTASWAPNKEIVAEFQMQHQGNMVAAVNNGQLSVSTTVPGYRQTNVVWKHEHSANKIMNTVKAEREGRPVYNHAAVINVKTTNSKVMADAQISLKTRGADEITFSLDHSHDRQNLEKIKSEYSLSWAPGKTASLSYDLDRTGNKIMWANVIFQSPFDGFERVALKSNTNKYDNAVSTSNELRWADGKKITVEAEATIRGYEFQVHGQAITPFGGWTSVVFNAENQKQNGIWMTHIDVDYGKRIEIDTEFDGGQRKLVMLHVKSPFEYLRNVFAKAELTGALRDFQYNVEIRHDKMTGKIKLNGLVNARDAKNIRLVANLRTPFEAAKFAKVTMNVIREDGSVHADWIVEHPSFKMKIIEDITYGLGRFINTKTVVEYMDDKRVELVSAVTIKPEISAKISLRSPFERLQEIDMILNHEPSASGFSTRGELSYSPQDKINANINYHRQNGAVTSRLEVTTPFSKLRRVALVLNHQGTLTDFKNDASFELNRMRISGKSEVKIRGDSRELKAEVQTPVEGYETITAELLHKGPITNFHNSMMLTMGTKQITGSGQFRLRKSSVTGSLELQLPFSNLRSVGLVVDHTGSWSNFNNKLIMAYNNKKILTRSSFKLDGNDVTGKISMKAPFPQLRAVAAQFHHEGSLRNFKNNIILTLNDRDFKADSQLVINGQTLSATGSVVLPSHDVRLEVNHNGPMTDFRNVALLTYNGKAYKGESLFSKSGNVINGKLTYSCPTRKASAEFNHRGGLTSFDNDAILMYNGKKAEARSRFNLAGSTMTAEASLDMPEHRMSLSASHNGPADRFKNRFNLQYNDRRFRGNSEFALTGSSVVLKASLSTPYRMIKSASIELNHDGPLTNFNNNAVLGYNNKQISGNSQFTLSGNRMNVKAELQAPETRLTADLSHTGTWSNFIDSAVLTYNGKRMELEVKHEGAINNFKNEFELAYGQRVVKGNSQFKLTSGRLYSMAELHLPLTTVKHVVAEFSHTGGLWRFEENVQLTVDENNIKGRSQFLLQGDTLNAKANLQTTFGLKPISVELQHRGPLNRFTEKILLSYGDRRATGTSEFLLTDDIFKLKADFDTSFCCVEPISVDVMYRGPVTGFTCRASAKYGGYEVITNNEFSLRGSALHLKSTMRTNVGDLKPVSVEVDHEGPLTDFSNSLLVSYGEDSISGTSEYKLEGNTLHLKATARTTIGRRVQPVAIEILHRGSINRFEEDITLSYGDKAITSVIKFNIERNAVTVEMETETPFRQIAKIVADISHNGKSWRNFENSATVQLNNDRYTGHSEFRWFGKIFKLIAETNVPDEYSIKINHKGSPTYFSNNLKIKIPGERISGTSSFKMAGNKVEGRASMDSTIRGFNNLDAAFTHEGSGRKFKTSFDLQTPFRNYKSFSGELNHEGTMDNFQTSGTLNLPFQKMRNVAVRANHQSGFNNFNTAASVSYDDKAISGAVNYKKTDMKVMADANLQTPYRGFENFGASMEHTGSRSNFQTNAAISTSIEGYERFAGKVSHRGDMNQFNTMAEVTTPIPKYNKFGFNVEHTGNRRNFKTSGSVTTSIPGYRRFAGSADYSYDGTKLRADGSIRTPFRGYEEFGLKADHTGMANGFRTSVEATSSIDGYEKFGASVEKKGSLNDFELTSGIQTPFRNYQNFATNLKYAGHPTSFRTSGHVETSIPGYERFSGSVNHNGNWRVFNTNAEVHTPIRGHEVYTMAIQHDGTDGIRTSGSVEYPGKKYGFSLNHRGTAKNFNTDLNIETPHRGYEQFGVTVDHSGDLSDMTQSGTIRLPLRSLPEIKYSVSHRGNLRDFTSSGSLEYNREKVEGSLSYKHTSSWGEDNYEGVLDIKATRGPIREIQLNAKHTGRPGQKSGTWDVTRNGQKMVDIDYDYSTTGEKAISIRVRHPEPFETKLRFQGDGRQFSGDAFLDWHDMFRGSGELKMKHEANDRAVDLKLVLPSRTVLLKGDYSATDTGIKHSADVQWGSGADSRLSYAMEASKTKRRRQTIMDGRFNIQSSKISGEATINHVYVPGRQYTTQLDLLNGKRTSIKSDLTIVNPRFQHTLTVEHPDLPQGASLKIGGLMDDNVYDGKIVLQMSNEVITFVGRVADESRPGSYRYESSCRLTHAGSDLDFQYSGTLKDNAESSSWEMETKYLMSKDKRHRVSSLRAEYDKTSNEATLKVVNPLFTRVEGPTYTILVSGRQVSASNGVYQYTGEASCGEGTIRAEVTLTMYKSADLMVYYNKDDLLRVSVKASPKDLQAEVYRVASGEKIPEASIVIRLDKERMISGSTYWRPGMYSDIEAAMATGSFGRSVKSELMAFIEAFQEEGQLKADYVRQNAKPLYSTVVDVRDTVISLYEEIRADMMKMYNTNEFHLRDIANWLRRFRGYVASTYNGLTSSARDNYTRARAVLFRSKRSLDSIVDRTWSYTEDIGTQISDWWSSLHVSSIIDRINSTARDLTERIANNPTVKSIVDTIMDTGYYPAWSSSGDEAVATAVSGPSLWDRISNRDDVQAGLSYLKKQITNSEIGNKYFEVKKTFDGIMDDIRQNGLKTVRANVMAWLKNYFQTDKDSFVFGDNDLRFSLYVPLPLDDLRSIPKVDINFSKYLRQAKNIYSNYLPKYDWTFWDYYYNYRPRSNIKDMIPPFKAHATLSGNQHYMTFDRRFYEFSGECSYLLARDFIDGTFSVIVNYERRDGRPAKKSVTVISNDKTVVISTDGRVMVDNSRVEMPLVIGGITIVRDENQIVVNKKNDLTVSCDLAHDQCTVEVSGWYYSKTGGLMGTYNNEQVDDFTTVDQQRLQNVGQFAASWSLGARCRPVNSAVEVNNEVDVQSTRYSICGRYFKDESSPLRRCFRVVDPEPFMKMCLNDIPRNAAHEVVDEDICDTAAFYISECQRAEVTVRIPSLCVRCMTEAGYVFSEGQNITLRNEEVSSSADVVFVIHHSECNKKMLENLKTLVDGLEKVFEAEHLTNNRYALVGYGGPGIMSSVHIHTMDGQVFATRDKILLGLENFHTTPGDWEDAMAAVKYATNLPFRVGVSKNILLLPCAPCRQGQATFSELQQLLLFRDINFHVLMQYNFLFKGNKNAATAYIFGADRETVYTRKDAGTTELVGDSEIRSQILMPKDLCVALSEETDGSVFNTLQYTASRPYIQKRFMDVLVRVIADKAEPSDCQICECRPDNVGAGKADCRHCVSPDPIYNILPSFEGLLPSRILQRPKNSEVPVAKSKSAKKAKKSKAKKSSKQLNAKKRAMRERRIERLEDDN